MIQIKILLAVMISITTLGCKKAVQQEATIASIIEYTKSLNNKKFDEITLEFDGIYKEKDATLLVNIGSSKITGYYDGDNLVKLKVFYNGSSGDLTVTFICKKNNPLFVRKTLINYNPPKHEKESVIINEIENKFYLSSTKILKFKNKGGIIRFNRPNKLNLELKFIELKKDYKNYFMILKKEKYKQ